EWHSERILLVNKIAKKLGVHIGTLIDLQGPELRINMPGEEIEVATGELLVIGEEAFEEDKKGFSITHPHIIEHVKSCQRMGEDVLAVEFHVVTKGQLTYLHPQTTCALKTRKVLNVP